MFLEKKSQSSSELTQVQHSLHQYNILENDFSTTESSNFNAEFNLGQKTNVSI